MGMEIKDTLKGFLSSDTEFEDKGNYMKYITSHWDFFVWLQLCGGGACRKWFVLSAFLPSPLGGSHNTRSELNTIHTQRPSKWYAVWPVDFNAIRSDPDSIFKSSRFCYEDKDTCVGSGQKGCCPSAPWTKGPTKKLSGKTCRHRLVGSTLQLSVQLWQHVLPGGETEQCVSCVCLPVEYDDLLFYQVVFSYHDRPCLCDDLRFRMNYSASTQRQQDNSIIYLLKRLLRSSVKYLPLKYY